MPEKTNRKIVCPACAGTNIEPRSVVVSVQPYPRPDPPEGPHPKRVIERKYVCKGCGREFSIIEELFE